tara:strand:+ start:646 stop:2310 length:1665 start_codon:yes stop_codon:yes gene_type:complete
MNDDELQERGYEYSLEKDEEEMYIHSLDEQDMDWITEVELPALIRAFEHTATQYSRENNLPAIMGYFNIMGSLLQDYIEIPVAQTSIDTRCHFVWIQTARTGKTTLIEYVLKPLATQLMEELDEAGYFEYKVISLDDYTTASLAGSHKENLKHDPAAQEQWTAEQARLITQRDGTIITQEQYDIQFTRAEVKYNKTKDEFFEFPSQLEGNGIWYADEFEGSGIFTPRTHNDNINIVLQTLMNNFHIGANQYHKVLTGKPTVTLDSRFSIFAGTYIPQKLDDTIIGKGIMQRFLPFIYEVPRDRLTAQRINLARSFGTRTEVRGPPTHLIEPMKEVVLKTKARFEEVGRDRELVITYSELAHIEIEKMYSQIQDYVSNLPPHIAEVVSTFEANLLEYINKLAVISCATNNANSTTPTWRLTTTHVLQGGSVVWMCYQTLVSYLEENLHIKRKPKMKPSSQLEKFKKAYEQALDVDILKERLIKCRTFDQPKIDQWKKEVKDLISEGFAYKKIVLEKAEKVMEKSKAVIADYWKDIEDKFEYRKIGNKPFIKPKED